MIVSLINLSAVKHSDICASVATKNKYFRDKQGCYYKTLFYPIKISVATLISENEPTNGIAAFEIRCETGGEV